MINKIIIVILAILISIVKLQASTFTNEYDPCSNEAERILNSYKNNESKFIDFGFQMLKELIKENKILDSIYKDKEDYLNKLTLKIIPIYKFNSDAVEYNYTQNVCQYFVLDTVDFSAQYYFLDKDSCIFFVTITKNELTNMDISGESGNDLNPNYFSIKFADSVTNYYNNLYMSNIDWFISSSSTDRLFFICNNIQKNISFYVKNLQFENGKDKLFYIVLGLGYFKIENLKILKMVFNKNNDAPEFSNKTTEKVNYFICDCFKKEWIQFCAKTFPVGGVPWWRFWDRWSSNKMKEKDIYFLGNGKIYFREKYLK